jgi:hypothetical protein
MKRIETIREEREKRFMENRMKLSVTKKNADLQRELEKNITLINEPKLKEKIQKDIRITEQMQDE